MSTETKDGGPAFPQADIVDGEGMSLRDWFAGQAIGHIITASLVSEGKVAWFDEAATQSYAIADALLKAREA